MKKKLTCLCLSLIMLLSVCLAGCAEKTRTEIDENIVLKASEDAETLSMYLMSEAPVSPDTAKRIQDAVNQVTESKFKTRMKLYFYTEAEYYEKLEAAFVAREESKANPGRNPQAEAPTTNTGDNKELIRYPQIADYQVDLFYFGGMDRYQKYQKAGLLANLEQNLSTSSKKLTEYISTQYFNSLRLNGQAVYAIPNNRPIGEYTYLMFNKDALKAMYQTASGITSLTDPKCQEILAFINDSATMRAQYVPLWTNVDNVIDLIPNLQVFGVDENGALSGDFSLIGNFYGTTDDLMTAGTQHAMINNLLNNTKFTDALRTLKMYDAAGYYGTEADVGRDFAVGVVQGGAELIEVYGDEYEMVVIENPRMSTEDLYGHMFGVSAYSSDIGRSMEILTYLNTNEDFRNLLLYGVEGEDYQLIDSGVAKDEFGATYKVVKRTNDSYLMAPEKTGNVFLTYQLQSENMIYALHSYGVNQNKTLKNSMVLGFSLAYAEEEGAKFVKSEGMQALRTLSAEILADYGALTDATDAFDTFLENSKKKFSENADVTALIVVAETHETDACGGTCGSLLCYHKAWLKANNVAAAS